jgi:NAD(P)-dependent dehydrogenase (short-subunit alcohol dehydrogenase family)
MTVRFAGQVVLVTGGGTGIGRATARAFARDGATVVVAGRTEEPLAETAALIGSDVADDSRASYVVADITRSDDVARLVETVVARHGRLDVAFNNAGGFAVGPLADSDEDGWAALLATNVTGTWLSMKHEIRHMRANGGGVIVNMSSVVGPHLTVPFMGAYAASKAAVSSLTRTAAKEAIGDGVRINALSPGPADTPMSMLPGETEAARADRMKEQLPIGRVGTLDEIAETALWLASPLSSFVVGHDLVVDGGSSA